MSCFYCGKRVSLVRKRSDADFCCDAHREKYHARTLRTIETLREADEQIAVTRRLNEGMPLRPSVPLRGRDPAELLQKGIGEPLLFGWIPAGLPSSRPRLATHVPSAALYAFGGARLYGGGAPPVVEAPAWRMELLQQRPPRVFTITIRLPQGGPQRIHAKPAFCDRPHEVCAVPRMELATAGRPLERRIAPRPAEKTMGALMRTARPPDPVRPPPPSPPVTVTLGAAAPAIRLAGPRRPAAFTVRLPSPGVAGICLMPCSAGERPAAPGYARMGSRPLILPPTRIGAGGMPRLREIRWGNRFVPCPDGFRRRQFYSWEALDRFCGMGFESIAGDRPAVHIAAEPEVAAHIDVARLWSAPQQDQATASPEPGRAAPPFPETLSLPEPVGQRTACGLPPVSAGRATIRAVDARQHFPTTLSWDAFAGLEPMRGSLLLRVPPARWACGTAEPYAIPAWARAQTRGSKRTASHLGIAVPRPVFAGPGFQAGARQAGPAPTIPLLPPLLQPAAAKLRGDAVAAAVRAARLPVLPRRDRGFVETGILVSACQAPVGRIPANGTVHPAHAIVLAPALPSAGVRAAAAGGLRAHPPARQSGSSFDVAKGSPQRLGSESLQRFRKRGYEAMRSHHATPQWPTPSAPDLARLVPHAPLAHPSRRPDSEQAVAMCRTHALPPPQAFRLDCAVMDSRLLAPAMPGSADWGRAPRAAAIAMPLALMLPIDLLGPIRDWGLAPPPEPEKPAEPIHEDFSAGLANWLCANADWRQDIAGVRTGSLALLRPSLNMSEYDLEFLCKIENRSIGWVFRAASTSNYHAAQIALDPASGAAHLARFSVLAGAREQPSVAPLDFALGKSSSCRVKMSVRGNEFKLFVNDKPAFDWLDDRLPEGGVGFFSDAEDRARLYWVKVTPHYGAHTEDTYPPMARLRAEIHHEMRMGV